MLGFVYESRTDQIRSEPIPQLIFGLTYLLILTRFIWPIDLPLWAKIVMAALAFVALQFHRWSRLSSGSEFSPEFPRPVVVLFNWAFGAIVLLALLQLLLDVGLLVGIVIHGGICYFVPKSQLAGPARMMLLILGGLAPFIYHSPQVTRNHVA